MEELIVADDSRQVAVELPGDETVQAGPAAALVIPTVVAGEEVVAVAAEPRQVVVESVDEVVPVLLTTPPAPVSRAVGGEIGQLPVLDYRPGPGADGEITVYLDCSRALAFRLDCSQLAGFTVVRIRPRYWPSGVFVEAWLMLTNISAPGVLLDFPIPGLSPSIVTGSREYVLRSWDGGQTLSAMAAGQYA